MTDPSLCYLVGHYSTSEHTAHLNRLLIELSDSVDVHVIVWSSDGSDVSLSSRSLTVLDRRWSRLPLRAIGLIRTVRSLRKNGTRVVFIRIAHHLAFLLGILRPFLGVRVYLWHSGMNRESAPRKGPAVRSLLAWLRWKILDVLLMMTPRVIDSLITGPESMARYYEEIYRVPRSKIAVLPNDVEVEYLRSKTREMRDARVRECLGFGNGDVLLYTGGLTEFRLGEEGALFRAVTESILRHRPTATVVGIGHQGVDGLRVWAAGSEGRVRLLDQMPFDILLGYYAAADIYVLPVRVAGFPRVLLEAMAVELPFVAFDVGGVGEVAGPDLRQQVIPPSDAAAFASRVVEMLESSHDLERVRAIGRDRVDRFDTKIVAEQLLSALHLSHNESAGP